MNPGVGYFMITIACTLEMLSAIFQFCVKAPIPAQFGKVKHEDCCNIIFEDDPDSVKAEEAENSTTVDTTYIVNTASTPPTNPAPQMGSNPDPQVDSNVI